MVILQVAGRALGELVRKLGERVLPSIIPILSRGLKDPSASRRQVIPPPPPPLLYCSEMIFILSYFLHQPACKSNAILNLSYCHKLIIQFLYVYRGLFFMHALSSPCDLTSLRGLYIFL